MHVIVSVRYCGYRGGAPAQDALSDHSTITRGGETPVAWGSVCVAAVHVALWRTTKVIVRTTYKERGGEA